MNQGKILVYVGEFEAHCSLLYWVTIILQNQPVCLESSWGSAGLAHTLLSPHTQTVKLLLLIGGSDGEL